MGDFDCCVQGHEMTAGHEAAVDRMVTRMMRHLRVTVGEFLPDLLDELAPEAARPFPTAEDDFDRQVFEDALEQVRDEVLRLLGGVS